MLTQDAISARATNYSCCALSYMHKYEQSQTYGGSSACEDRNYRLAMYMHWASSVAQRAAGLIGGDFNDDFNDDFSGGGVQSCLELAFVKAVFAKADCYCSSCGCGEEADTSVYPPPPDPCAPVITYSALAAVDVADRAAIQAGPPAVGATYFVVNDTGGSGWTINTLVEWNGTGWDVTNINNGDIIDVGGGELWTTLGWDLPGLLYPTVTLTWVGTQPEQYVLQSDYPQVALFAGRTAIVELFTPGGWVAVFQGPEANLAAPIPFDATGFTFTAVTVTYVQGDCSWTASTGNIEPPGCVFPGAHSCDSHAIDSHF